jgi:pimeloyl-ACP methyl ester carboxylesterase
VPVLGLYGAKDTGIPLESSKDEGGAGQGAERSAFVVYPDAGHAFHADYRPSYVEGRQGRLDARAGLVQAARRCLMSQN